MPIAPQFRTFTPNVLSQTPQKGAVEHRIDSLTLYWISDPDTQFVQYLSTYSGVVLVEGRPDLSSSFSYVLSLIKGEIHLKAMFFLCFSTISVFSRQGFMQSK